MLDVEGLIADLRLHDHSDPAPGPQLRVQLADLLFMIEDGSRLNDFGRPMSGERVGWGGEAAGQVWACRVPACEAASMRGAAHASQAWHLAVVPVDTLAPRLPRLPAASQPASMHALLCLPCSPPPLLLPPGAVDVAAAGRGGRSHREVALALVRERGPRWAPMIAEGRGPEVVSAAARLPPPPPVLQPLACCCRPFRSGSRASQDAACRPAAGARRPLRPRRAYSAACQPPAVPTCPPLARPPTLPPCPAPASPRLPRRRRS